MTEPASAVTIAERGSANDLLADVAGAVPRLEIHASISFSPSSSGRSAPMCGIRSRPNFDIR